MNVLITYDVRTDDAAGRARLRKVARICEGFGQRVQYSVFEVVCSQADLARLLDRLTQVIEPSKDSLRAYPIHSDNFEVVTTIGSSMAVALDESWTL